MCWFVQGFDRTLEMKGLATLNMSYSPMNLSQCGDSQVLCICACLCSNIERKIMHNYGDFDGVLVRLYHATRGRVVVL